MIIISFYLNIVLDDIYKKPEVFESNEEILWNPNIFKLPSNILIEKIQNV